MATTLKLYEAAAALADVNAWIEEHDDELLANGGALPPALEELLAQAEGDFRTKVERVALKVRELKATAAAVKVEQDRLAQMVRVAENAAKSLTEYLKRQMEAAGETKVEGTLVKVRVQNNPPSLRADLSQAQLEALYHSDTEQHAALVRFIPSRLELDARAAIDLHKRGGTLPAGLTVEQGTHVRIA